MEYAHPRETYTWIPTAQTFKGIAVFPILADVVKVRKGSWLTAHWSIDCIRLSRGLRRCFTLLITPLDIDGIGQNWEDSNIYSGYPVRQVWRILILRRLKVCRTASQYSVHRRMDFHCRDKSKFAGL